MNRAVNHHVIAFVREPGSRWLAGAETGKPFVPRKGSEAGATGFLAAYAPGTAPDQLKPGQARRIRAGSDIVFQLHWTANGKPALDQAKLGLIFAKQEPREEILTLQALNARFEIPAGAENHRVDARVTLQTEATLELLAPHMHLRGKAFGMQVKLPDGEVREILRVPRYDFNWQLSYVLSEPMRLPAGTQVMATGWFDNSANNKNNPDPSKAVRWGNQSWEEMMVGFFNVSVPVGTTYLDLMRPKKKPAAGPSGAGGLE